MIDFTKNDTTHNKYITNQSYTNKIIFHFQLADIPVTICTYPFVFDAQAKTTLLQTDAVLQMQVKYYMVLI